MSDHLQYVQIERNRLQHLLTEADTKTVRKTLRACVQLIDCLLAQQHPEQCHREHLVRVGTTLGHIGATHPRRVPALAVCAYLRTLSLRSRGYRMQ